MISRLDLELLKESSDLSNELDIFNFIKITEQIDTEDEEFLPELFLVFNDNCKNEEVMFDLIHVVESFKDPFYIRCLLQNLRLMYKNSQYWSQLLFVRILNDMPSFQTLKKNIHLADKETMLKLLDNMENDKYCPEQHKPIIKELRELLNKK